MKRIQSGKKVNMRKEGKRERERGGRRHSVATHAMQIATIKKQRKHKQVEAFSSSLIFLCYLYINNI